MNKFFVLLLLAVVLVGCPQSSQGCGDGVCQEGENSDVCPVDCTEALPVVKSENYQMQPISITTTPDLSGQVVENGDSVKVNYLGKLLDGTVFDSTQGKPPFELTVGQPGVIQGFSEGLTGMTLGEKKTLTIPAEKAYGAPNPELVKELAIEEITAQGIEPMPGQVLYNNGVPIVVLEVGEKTVKLDFNHPLAGKTLVFDVEVIQLIKNK